MFFLGTNYTYKRLVSFSSFHFYCTLLSKVVQLNLPFGLFLIHTKEVMLLLGCVNVCMCYFLCKRDGSKFWINSVKNLQGCRAAWLETSAWSVTRAWGGWSQSQLPEGYSWVLPDVGAAHLRLLGLKYLLLQQGEELDILCLASYLVIEMYMKMKQAELGASVLMISGFTSGSNFWKHYVPLRGRETSQLWLSLSQTL